VAGEANCCPSIRPFIALERAGFAPRVWRSASANGANVRGRHAWLGVQARDAMPLCAARASRRGSPRGRGSRRASRLVAAVLCGNRVPPACACARGLVLSAAARASLRPDALSRGQWQWLAWSTVRRASPRERDVFLRGRTPRPVCSALSLDVHLDARV